MFCNFYLVEIWKITKLLITQILKLDKSKHIFGILRILEIFGFVFDQILMHSNFT
jgi:hypothetical protein